MEVFKLWGGVWTGTPRLCPQKFFLKFDVHIYRFLGILTAIKSLVLAVAGNLSAFGGTQKSVMSKPHMRQVGLSTPSCPTSPRGTAGGRGSWDWKPYGPVDSPM